ncbi:hypothetical protein BH10BAC2_BH10BAC2_27050 [soil metagenome]
MSKLKDKAQSIATPTQVASVNSPETVIKQHIGITPASKPGENNTQLQKVPER